MSRSSYLTQRDHSAAGSQQVFRKIRRVQENPCTAVSLSGEFVRDKGEQAVIDGTRYTVGTRGKGEPSTGTNHLGFRLMMDAR